MASPSGMCSLLVAFLLASSSCVVAEVRRELTTRSWDALGFHETVKRSPREDQIIVGVIDSGIWPESLSFRDDGLGPPPTKWKGICQPNGFDFTCSNKIIGARFYKPDPSKFNITSNEELSPRDFDGHGTHVAATIAGVPVKGVAVNGVGTGTARGAMPRARIAVYKVCYGVEGSGGCWNIDKAIIDAVNDGVDVISISIGGAFAIPYSLDENPAATFYAMKHGVLVSYAAGNDGPQQFRVGNVEPWALTVANSYINGSEYATYVTLGNGKKIKGHDMNSRDLKIQYPLVYGAEVTRDRNESTAIICNRSHLISKLIKGKIVLCDGISDLDFSNTGAAGIIFQTSNFDRFGEAYSYDEVQVPVVGVSRNDFMSLVQYLFANSSPSNRRKNTATASISKTTEVMTRKPRVAISSSRGPNVVDPEILKPDLSAPGVNIIAAVKGDKPTFNSLTGTSMSCPHASGIAAYVKSFHPKWSSSAIKSALITTATPMGSDKDNNMAELAYGAGELNPVGAVDPGLVYDLSVNDYLKYLCRWSGFSNAEVVFNVTAKDPNLKVINVTRDPNFNCSKLIIGKGWSLNLATFSIPVKPYTPFTKVFRREVTNVGSPATSNYKAIVYAPKGLEIKVNPTVLSFKKMYQKLSYTVSIKGSLDPDNSDILSAAIVWTDGRHNVKSPIVVYPRFDQVKVLKQLLAELETSESQQAGRASLY